MSSDSPNAPPTARDAAPDAAEPLPDGTLVPGAQHRLGRYLMRFARTRGDLDAICRLRFAVFNLELAEGFAESYATGRDSDRFDAQCQHLMVIDTKTDDVVGTYRLQVAESARNGSGWYSASEFALTDLPDEVLAESVELGRACVVKEHRSRGVLFLLWRGLVEYVRHNRRRSFFGCSSLTSQDPNEGWRCFRQLERAGRVHPEYRVQPLPGHDCVEDRATQTAEEVRIPPLFDTYLKYGARVLGPPAIDREFGTIDFLTFHVPTDEQLRTFGGAAGA